jgi:hypothetical protein
MGVVRAPVQTVEEIYRLVWAAAANKQPIEAVYQGRLRLLCPHRLGRNREGQVRVICYQYGGDSGSGLQPVGSPEIVSAQPSKCSPSHFVSANLSLFCNIVKQCFSY